jgi:hypothetical protein
VVPFVLSHREILDRRCCAGHGRAERPSPAPRGRRLKAECGGCAAGVGLFLHQRGLDTSTPAGKAMFQMLGVFAEFERSMIRERVMAGLSRAKAEGTQLGRRRIEDTDAGKVTAIVAARAKGMGIRRISAWAWAPCCV